MTEEKTQIEMTAEEAVEFERFKQEKAKKAIAEKAKLDREAYSKLVDEEIERAIPLLEETSSQLVKRKNEILDNFSAVLEMKSYTLKKTKSNQKSHTWTNSEGNKRITIGRYYIDGWKDTVNDGVDIVKESVMGLINDEKTEALVNQILRLISRDSQGNLKANKVLQLDKLAADLKNDRLNEGIAIIKEAHIPSLSKTYIRAERMDDKGNWSIIPLGMTEA